MLTQQEFASGVFLMKSLASKLIATLLQVLSVLPYFPCVVEMHTVLSPFHPSPPPTPFLPLLGNVNIL